MAWSNAPNSDPRQDVQRGGTGRTSLLHRKSSYWQQSVWRYIASPRGKRYVLAVQQQLPNVPLWSVFVGDPWSLWTMLWLSTCTRFFARPLLLVKVVSHWQTMWRHDRHVKKEKQIDHVKKCRCFFYGLVFILNRPAGLNLALKKSL